MSSSKSSCDTLSSLFYEYPDSLSRDKSFLEFYLVIEFPGMVEVTLALSRFTKRPWRNAVTTCFTRLYLEKIDIVRRWCWHKILPRYIVYFVYNVFVSGLLRSHIIWKFISREFYPIGEMLYFNENTVVYYNIRAIVIVLYYWHYFEYLEYGIISNR